MSSPPSAALTPSAPAKLAAAMPPPTQDGELTLPDSSGPILQSIAPARAFAYVEETHRYVGTGAKMPAILIFHPELHPALQNDQRGAPPIDGLPRAAVVRAVGFEPTT